MEEKELLKKIALLESVNDQLLSEISYIDELMKSLGFSEGIQTVKATAEDLSDEMEDEDEF